MGFTIYWTWIEPPDKNLFAQWTVDAQKLVANFNQSLDLVDTPLEDEVKSVITEQKVAFTNDKFEAFWSIDLADLNPQSDAFLAKYAKFLPPIENRDPSVIYPTASSDYWKTGSWSFDIMVQALLIRLIYYFPTFKVEGGYPEEWELASQLCQRLFGVGEIPKDLATVIDEDEEEDSEE